MSLSDPNEVAKQYENASNLNSRITLHQRFSVNEYPWHRWTFDHLDLPENARILELGCGTAALWTENKDRIPETWQTTLTDASPGMLDAARQSINLNLRNTLTRNFMFISTSARDIAFGESEFDTATASYMLYHVPDRARAISEVARVLKSGEVLYAATNGREHLREGDGWMGSLAPAHPEYGLARRFSGFSLENGASQLSERFSEVSLVRHEDELRVTEAEPLLAWILSTITAREIVGRIGKVEFRQRVSRLSEALEEEISERGEIRVSKDVGLFIARL